MPVKTTNSALQKSTNPLCNHDLAIADRVYRFILERSELTPEHNKLLTSYDKNGAGISIKTVIKLQFRSTTKKFIEAIEQAKQHFTTEELLKTPGFWAISHPTTTTSTIDTIPPSVCTPTVERNWSDQSDQSHHQPNHQPNPQTSKLTTITKDQIKTRPFFPKHPHLVIPLFTVINNKHYIYGLKFRTNSKDEKHKYHAFSRSRNRTRGNNRTKLEGEILTTPLKQYIYYPHLNEQADVLVITEGEKKAVCLLDQQQRLLNGQNGQQIRSAAPTTNEQPFGPFADKYPDNPDNDDKNLSQPDNHDQSEDQSKSKPDPLCQYASEHYSADLLNLLQPNVQYASIGGINFHHVLTEELRATRRYNNIVLLPDTDVFSPILYKCVVTRSEPDPENPTNPTNPSRISPTKNASQAFTELYDHLIKKLPDHSAKLGVWFTQEQQREPSTIKKLIPKGIDDLLTDGDPQNFRVLNGADSRLIVAELFSKKYKIPLQWVYLYEGPKDKHIYNKHTGLSYKEREFGLQSGIDLKPKQVEEIIASGFFPKFQSLIFRPGEPEVVIHEYSDEIVKYLNTWCENIYLKRSQPCGEPTEIPPAFNQFLHDLIPNDEERFYLIETIAFSVQYPEKRKKYAVTLLGPNRVGKSLLLDLIACMTSKPKLTEPQWRAARRRNEIPKGRHSVQIDSDHLTGKNKMFLGEMLDVFVHEFYTSTNKDTVATQATLKNMLTAESLFVEDKYVSLHETNPFFNIWLATNHSDAIKSDDVAADQRFLVLQCTGRRAQPIATEGDTHERPEWRHLPSWTSAKIDEQAEQVKSELEDIYHYFANYQITTRNIRVMPMITDGLREMHNQGQVSWANRRYKVELAERMSEAVEAQKGVFASPVLRPRDVTTFFAMPGKEIVVGMAATNLDEYLYRLMLGSKKRSICVYINKELVTDKVDITYGDQTFVDPYDNTDTQTTDTDDPCVDKHVDRNVDRKVDKNLDVEGWTINTLSEEINRDRYHFIAKFNDQLFGKSFKDMYPPLWEAIPATTETNTPSTTRSLADAEKYKEYPLFHNQRIAHAMICVALEKYTQPEFNQLQTWLNHHAEARGKRKSKVERITQANTKKQAVLRLYGELVLDKMNGENQRIRVAELDIRNPLLADLMERAYY